MTRNKRRKITTERFDNLKDICSEYDNLSGPERQERLIEFLGLFARRDAIRDLNSQLILTQKHLPLIMQMNKHVHNEKLYPSSYKAQYEHSKYIFLFKIGSLERI